MAGNKLFGQAKISNFRPTVAAEDARFYQHHGFDGHDVQIAAEHDLEGDLTHGVSTYRKIKILCEVSRDTIQGRGGYRSPEVGM